MKKERRWRRNENEMSQLMSIEVASPQFYNLSEVKYKLRVANIEKGRPLEFATKWALESLHLHFKDRSRIFNFKNKGKGKNNTADFYCEELGLIEDKNWNCINYEIENFHVNSEILARFNDDSPEFEGTPKTVIISNPKYKTPSSKNLMKALLVNVIELGYKVTWNNIVQAKNDIVRFFRRYLGYVIDNNKNNRNMMEPSTKYNINSTYSKTEPKSILDNSQIDSQMETNVKNTEKIQSKPPLLGCHNCKRNYDCQLYKEYQNIVNKKPIGNESRQSHIDYSEEQIQELRNQLWANRRDKLKTRKQWLKELGELEFQVEKCLNKRIFLHSKLNYDLFETRDNRIRNLIREDD